MRYVFFKSGEGLVRSHLYRFTIFSVLVGVLSGCQTARYRGFDDVHMGMAKDEVLAAVGNPDRTARKRDQDRWTYIFWDHPMGRKVSEVWFSDGLAVYVGPEVQSKITPEQQDAINLGSAYVPRFEEVDPTPGP